MVDGVLLIISDLGKKQELLRLTKAKYDEILSEIYDILKKECAQAHEQ